MTAPAQAGPTLRLTPDIAPTGTRATLVLEGWTGSTSVVAELCGNAPDPRSSDCDLARSEGGNVAADGAAVLDLVLGEPPSPCPCIVRVRAADATGEVASAPVVLTDVAPRPDGDQADQLTTTTTEAVRDPATVVTTTAEVPAGLVVAGAVAAAALVAGLVVRRRRRRRSRRAEGQASPIA